MKKQKMLFGKVKQEQLTKNLLSTTNNIELGKYRKFIFRNIDEILKYVNLLWDNNKLNEFNDFKENCFSEIDALKAKANQQQKAQLDEYINRVNSCICFDEYIFKDVESLEQQINEYSGPVKDRFTELHQDGLSRALRKLPKAIRKGLEKSLAFDISLVEGVKEIGSYVKFGNYWQSNDKNKEAIEWKVLAKENGKALLISKYALDCKPYNQNNCNITWEECTLRKWINSDFINNAFSEEEQQIIALTKNDTNGSRTTEDKVFLLSIEEAQKYFKNAEERKCMPTPYAKQHKAWSKDNFCYWWLRSPGGDQYDAALVSNDGDVYYYGFGVNDGDYAVRVALWVNLES